jgi:putative ABC transport system permease protein
VLSSVRVWEEVRVAAPRSRDAVPLLHPGSRQTAVAAGNGIDPETEYALRPANLQAGRPIAGADEIVLTPRLAEALGAEVGDLLDVQKWGEPVSLEVVGITQPPALGMFARGEAYLARETLGRISGYPDRIREIAMDLRPGADAMAIADARSDDLPDGVVVEPTELVTSGIDRSLRSSRVGFTLVSILSFIAAGFIILSGMTTSVLEKQRELAVIRCIGGTSWQLAQSQLAVGAIIGGVGGLIGAPIGVGLSAIGAAVFSTQLPAGLQVSEFGLTMATLGSLGAGIGGAVWPAVVAARLSPLQGLASRAKEASRRSLVIASAVGAGLALTQFLVVTIPDDGNVVFWSHTSFGAVFMLVGYFLLSAPLIAVIARLAGPLLGRALALPPRILPESVSTTPFRHGFTAGALMAGLGLMGNIWSVGDSILDDWLGGIEFPDAFVHSWAGLTPAQREKVERLPFVEETCAITLQQVGADIFGVQLLQDFDTNFVGFEPAPFFRMTKLTWVEGDPETALAALEAGGAILIAREFKVANNLGVGDTFTIEHQDESFTFDIVGVVASPGLDIAKRYFDVGQQYANQALHAVFGSRRDMVEKLGNDQIDFLQIDLSDEIDDREAIKQIRASLSGTILAAGSGREIKQTVYDIGRNTMFVLSSVSIAAIVIACFGVGNVIVAGIDARRREFGVLRAIGAERGTLARLVIGEVLLIGVTACILGALLSVQTSWTGVRMYTLLAGLDLSLRFPLVPLLVGAGILFALTLAAATPSVIALLRRTPRDLLSSTRG